MFKMKHESRNTIKYRVTMWFYRLTLDDIIFRIRSFKETIGSIIALIFIFALLFFLPHFFF